MNWTTDWPTTEGWHWLYGHDHHVRRSVKRLYAVWVWYNDKVRQGEWTYSYFGGKMTKANGAGGLWQPIQLPELPGKDT